ncbi:MAG: type II toxin-antitoxin system Phd/YefM family antitoxin [Oscillospiraceae bacterium]|nr:type II toxin-antitoxin system Phd/YefM family antitoxin [Oscillospiraceae bacterium]
MPNIQPSTILGTHYNDISSFCNDNREPMFITKNGQGDLAVMSIEMYENLNGKQELYRLLDEGMADIQAGRVRHYNEVFDEIEQEILDGHL